MGRIIRYRPFQSSAMKFVMFILEKYAPEARRPSRPRCGRSVCRDHFEIMKSLNLQNDSGDAGNLNDIANIHVCSDADPSSCQTMASASFSACRSPNWLRVFLFLWLRCSDGVTKTKRSRVQQTGRSANDIPIPSRNSSSTWTRSMRAWCDT